jgi:hypothetical protein
MRHFQLFQNKLVQMALLISALTSCSVLNNRKQMNIYCSALSYFLEQDSRLKLLDRGNSDNVSFYSNQFESLDDCLARDIGVLFVGKKSQLPKNGVSSYQLKLSVLNVSKVQDGVLLTFIHLGAGSSYEVIVQIEERGPYILNIREFQFNASSLE